jgi:copper resistance protein C
MRHRRALVPLLSGALALGVAAPALAHTELLSSTPKGGASVARLPATLKLNFSEPPLRIVSVKLIGPGKRDHAKRARFNPTNAKQVIVTTTKSAAGAYSLRLNLVAPDGDAQAVTLAFRVKR